MEPSELTAIFEADAQRMMTEAAQLDAQAKELTERAARLRGAAEYARSAAQMMKTKGGEEDEHSG